MEFLKSYSEGLIIAVVCAIVIFFVLRKIAFKIIKRIIVGLFLGLAVSAFLYYVIQLPVETVGLIGVAAFLLGAIFGKIK